MTEDEIHASANPLRNALARLDTNGDGFLNFQEFHRGLRELGVQLSDQEVENIWKDAAATSTPRAAEQTEPFSEAYPTQLRGEDLQVRSSKKMVKNNTAHLSTNLGSGGIGYVNGDAEVTTGMEGSMRYSQKKTKGFEGHVPHETRNMEWTETGLSTQQLKERKRNNLMPDHGHMKHIFPQQDTAETARSAETPLAGSPGRVHINFAKGPGSAKKLGADGSSTVRSSLASQRILQQFVEKKDLIEKEMRKHEVVEPTGRRILNYDGFKQGLEGGGLLMGQEDTKDMWALAGGEFSNRTDDPNGNVDFQRFMRKLTSTPAEVVAMKNDGYKGQMQSSMNRNLTIEGSPPSHQGGIRAGIRPQDDSEILCHRDAEAPTSQPRARLSKTDEVVRELIRRNKRSIFRAFNAESDGRGASYGFLELRDRFLESGVNLASRDFETLWRRADRACIGRVTWEDVKEGFELQAAAQRPGRGLPHLPLNESGLTPLPGSGVQAGERLDHKDVTAPPNNTRTKGEEDGDEEQPRAGLRHADKLIRNMLIHKADSAESLAAAMGPRPLQEAEFKMALGRAGIILNDDDASTFFHKTAKDGLVSAKGVTQAMEQVRLLSEDTPSSLLGFGTGEKMFKPLDAAAKHKGRGEDTEMRRIYWKVANSMVGNPHRLRKLFRKLDVDRTGDVTTSEFLSALLANHVPLHPQEARLLGQVADMEDRGVVPYEQFISMVAQVSGQRSGKTAGLDAPYGPGLETNQSVESVSSMASRPGSRAGGGGLRRERSGSSIGSVRSERSTASSRGTLGAGLKHERSDWMMDATLRDSERKEARGRGAAPVPLREERAARPQDEGRQAAGGGTGGRVLHLAAPPLAFD